MHIAYLIPTIDRIGGAERQLILLAIGMARRGWRVTVIALRGKGGHAADELALNNVSFVSLEMSHGLVDPHGWIRLRRWIISARPEVLHAHLPQAALMARGIRLIASVRALIDTLHSPALGSSARQLGYRITSRIPDSVTAVSHSCARPWLGARVVDPSSLAVIPNGIDTTFWKPGHEPQGGERSPSTSTHGFHWLAVGRLHAVKDYATLLHAFAMLPQSARLTIAGSGPLEHTLRLQAKELNVQDRVQFLGFQNDVRQLMQSADALVLSSRWEGLPLALMEACACQLPAVLTETTGSRELLPGSSLPIAPVGDPVALAGAMNTLMNLSLPERRELGLQARLQIIAGFDLASVVDRYEILYCRLLEANPRPSRTRIQSGSPRRAPVCPSNQET
jgi:glycosyltransferase involved in cell wall biosynthesis